MTFTYMYMIECSIVISLIMQTSADASTFIFFCTFKFRKIMSFASPGGLAHFITIHKQAQSHQPFNICIFVVLDDIGASHNCTI